MTRVETCLIHDMPRVIVGLAISYERPLVISMRTKAIFHKRWVHIAGRAYKQGVHRKEIRSNVDALWKGFDLYAQKLLGDNNTTTISSHSHNAVKWNARLSHKRNPLSSKEVKSSIVLSVSHNYEELSESILLMPRTANTPFK